MNSKHLGQDKIDQVGLNKGLYELASADEVCAYYTQVIHDTFLPSGRVRYFPKCEWNGGRSFQSDLTGQKFEVGEKTRIVDATYMKVTVPSMRPPAYQVAKEVSIVTPNDLTKLSRPYANYTVVGSGKTGIDTCIWLLTMGISPDQITWVMPRDAWLYDRALFQSLFVTRSKEAAMQHFECTVNATSVDDYLLRLEAAGQLLRIDKKVWPTSFRCATVTLAELAEIRKIENVIRLGRIVSINAEEVVFQRGSRRAKPDTVYIDCSADGLEKREAMPIFTAEKITLQPVRHCQQVFSAAFIGHVEASYSNEVTKNELCRPIPHPMLPVDLAVCSYLDYQAVLRWSLEPKTVTWLVNSRLNWSPALSALATDDAEKRGQAMERLHSHMGAMSKNLKKILEALPAKEEGRQAKI